MILTFMINTKKKYNNTKLFNREKTVVQKERVKFRIYKRSSYSLIIKTKFLPRFNQDN